MTRARVTKPGQTKNPAAAAMAGRIKARISAAVFKFVTIAEDHGKQKDKQFCTKDLWQQIGEANEN